MHVLCGHKEISDSFCSDWEEEKGQTINTATTSSDLPNFEDCFRFTFDDKDVFGTEE